MNGYFKICFPCAMRLDLFYTYRPHFENKPLEEFHAHLNEVGEGIDVCTLPEDRECWSRFMVGLVPLFEENLRKLREVSHIEAES